MKSIIEALKQRNYNPDACQVEPTCPEEKRLRNGQSWCLLSDNPCYRHDYRCDYYNEYVKELNNASKP